MIYKESTIIENLGIWGMIILNVFQIGGIWRQFAEEVLGESRKLFCILDGDVSSSR